MLFAGFAGMLEDRIVEGFRCARTRGDQISSWLRSETLWSLLLGRGRNPSESRAEPTSCVGLGSRNQAGNGTETEGGCMAHATAIPHTSVRVGRRPLRLRSFVFYSTGFGGPNKTTAHISLFLSFFFKIPGCSFFFFFGRKTGSICEDAKRTALTV